MAKTFIQLIQTEYLKDRTVIDENVDGKLILTSIIDAQEINIQQILGTKLYEKIMQDVNDETITDEYRDLLVDFIKPAQAAWAFYQLIPYINYKITNKNVAERYSDNSNTSELKIVSYLRKNAEDKAQYYSQRLTDYILNNQILFPEYYNSTLAHTIRPERQNFFSGVQFPKRFGRDYFGPGTNYIKLH